eukprot:4316016-Prymnesium_polylepis.1
MRATRDVDAVRCCTTPPWCTPPPHMSGYYRTRRKAWCPFRTDRYMSPGRCVRHKQQSRKRDGCE